MLPVLLGAVRSFLVGVILTLRRIGLKELTVLTSVALRARLAAIARRVILELPRQTGRALCAVGADIAVRTTDAIVGTCGYKVARSARYACYRQTRLDQSPDTGPAIVFVVRLELEVRMHVFTEFTISIFDTPTPALLAALPGAGIVKVAATILGS